MIIVYSSISSSSDIQKYKEEFEHPSITEERIDSFDNIKVENIQILCSKNTYETFYLIMSSNYNL